MKLLFVLFVLASLHSAFSSEIKVAISSAPNNLNPFFSTDANSQNINRLIHKALIDFNNKMQYECNACSSYEETMSGQKHIIKFKLRTDLTFSDGSPVTVEDVKKSWEYFAKNETIKSTFIEAFENLEDLKITGKNEIEVIFKKFSLENISNIGIIKIVKINKPVSDHLEPEEIIGYGEYVLQKISPLEIVVAPRDPSKNTFIFKVVKDETTLALKLINKEIDLSVASMSPRKIYWLKEKTKGIKVWEIPSGNFLFMGINHKREKFQNLKVRKALSLLIPREDLLKYKLKNTAVLSNGMFSPAFADLYEANDPIDAYNPELAAKLLKEAGYSKNKKGLLEKDGQVLEIDWKVSNNKAAIEVVEVIQSYFAKAGVVVNMSIMEWGTFMSAFKGGNFDIVMSQWIGFTGPDMMNFVFYSKNTPPKGGNRISYNNAEFDKVIDEATVETDAKKRNTLYKKALKLVNEDYAYINLWHPNIIWIGSDCLKNLELEPTGGFYPLLKMENNCGK